MWKARKKFHLLNWLKSATQISCALIALLLIEVIVDIAMYVIGVLESLITIVLGLIIVLDKKITLYSIFSSHHCMCIFVWSYSWAYLNLMQRYLKMINSFQLVIIGLVWEIRRKLLNKEGFFQ
jgi:hypothetical protein